MLCAASGFGLHALAGLLSILLVIVAVAAVFALLLALLLYLTGRGIGQHATWARIVAILLSLSLAHRAFALHALGADLVLRLKPRTRVVG
jgi:hypothetical protein